MSYATRTVVQRLQNPLRNGTIEKSLCPVVEPNELSSTGFIAKGLIPHRENPVTHEDDMLDLDTRWGEVSIDDLNQIVEAAITNPDTKSVRMISSAASGQVRVRNQNQPNEQARDAWITLTAMGSEPASLVQLRHSPEQIALAHALGCDYQETSYSGQAGQYQETLINPICVLLSAATKALGVLDFPKFERENERPSRADLANPNLREIIAHFDETGQVIERQQAQGARGVLNASLNERFLKKAAAQAATQPQSRFQNAPQNLAPVPQPAVSAGFARYAIATEE